MATTTTQITKTFKSDPLKILVGDFYSNYTHQRKPPPKSGYGFLQAMVSGVVSRGGELVEILDASHKEGGNPGYPAEAMLLALAASVASTVGPSVLAFMAWRA